MKTKTKFMIGLAALLAGVLFIGTGCKSTSANLGVTTATVDTNGVLSIGGAVVQPAAAGVAVQMGAKYGALALLKQYPDSRQYLAIGAGVIDAAIIAKDYNPTNLQNSLQAALLPATSADNAAAISGAIKDGLDLYGAFYGQAMRAQLADASPYLAPCLQGLADGVTQALAAFPAPSPAFESPTNAVNPNP
jgi:hypothetical protein